MSSQMSAMRGTLAADWKDRRFAERVDEIRLGVSDTYIDAGEYAYFQKEDAFPKLRDAIEEYFGLTFGGAKDEILRLIEKRPPPIQEILINTLSECRRVAPKGEQTAIAWLTSVIDAAETDPWQERARAAVAARDWPGLERMLTGEQAANRPAARLLRLVALVPARKKKQESTYCGASKSPIPMTSGRHSRWDVISMRLMSGMKRYATSPPPWRCDRRVRQRSFSSELRCGTRGG